MLGEGGGSQATLLWLLLGFSALYPRGQEGPRNADFSVLEVEPKAAQRGLSSCTGPSPNRAKTSHRCGG